MLDSPSVVQLHDVFLERLEDALNWLHYVRPFCGVRQYDFLLYSAEKNASMTIVAMTIVAMTMRIMTMRIMTVTMRIMTATMTMRIMTVTMTMGIMTVTMTMRIMTVTMTTDYLKTVWQ